MQSERGVSRDELTQWNDVALIRAGRERGDPRAVLTLVERWLPRAFATVRAQSRGHGLLQEDLEDAEQEAVLGIVAAYRCYRLPAEGEPARCDFGTLLWRVLRHDLQDAGRRRQLARKCFVPLGPAGDGRGVNDRAGPRRSPDPLADPFPDPARLAERREALSRLHEVLEGLGRNSQLLWEQKQSGGSLRAFAKKRHLPDGRVKRQWRKAVEQLKTNLCSYLD